MKDESDATSWSTVHHVPSTALVVGGSLGIGKAAVQRLAALGTRCAIGYSASDQAAKDLVAEVVDKGGPAPVLVRGDVRTDAPEMVAQAADLLGGLGGLVCTPAPRAGLGRILDVSKEDLHSSIDVMVWGLLDLVRAAVPALAASGGSVVAVSSLGADHYTKYYGGLGPGKGALEALVRYLGAELGPKQIRVNAVSPSLIDDEEHRPEGAEVNVFLAPVAQRTPLRRLAVPTDIADVIVALLTPAFRYVTGQVIVVDGGYSLLA